MRTNTKISKAHHFKEKLSVGATTTKNFVEFMLLEFASNNRFAGHLERHNFGDLDNLEGSLKRTRRR